MGTLRHPVPQAVHTDPIDPMFQGVPFERPIIGRWGCRPFFLPGHPQSIASLPEVLFSTTLMSRLDGFLLTRHPGALKTVSYVQLNGLTGWLAHNPQQWPNQTCLTGHGPFANGMAAITEISKTLAHLTTRLSSPWNGSLLSSMLFKTHLHGNDVSKEYWKKCFSDAQTSVLPLIAIHTSIEKLKTSKLWGKHHRTTILLAHSSASFFWGTLNHGYNHWTNPPFLLFWNKKNHPYRPWSVSWATSKWASGWHDCVRRSQPLSFCVSGTGGCCIRYGYSRIIMGI